MQLVVTLGLINQRLEVLELQSPKNYFILDIKTLDKSNLQVTKAYR